jgi:hypothetical protein
VSFGTYERKVRNPSLPYRQRFNALVRCVEHYSPLGFHATFGYLEHVAGRIRHEENALIRAVDALVSSRDRWLIELNVYAAERRAAKRRGRRNAPMDGCFHAYSTWHGDAKNAAIFALEFLLRPAGPNRPGRVPTIDAAVLRLASALLEHGGHLNSAQVEQARLLRNEFQHLQRVSGWPDVDWTDWHRATDSLRALHLIDDAYAPEPSAAIPTGPPVHE